MVIVCVGMGHLLLCRNIRLLGTPGSSGRQAHGHNDKDEDGKSCQYHVFVLLHHWKAVVESLGTSNAVRMIATVAIVTIIDITIVSSIDIGRRQINILKAGNVGNLLRCLEAI